MSSARIVQDNWREVEIVITRNVKGGVRKVLLELERQIKANIVGAGLVDTGNYLRSWIFAVNPDGLGAEGASDLKAPGIKERAYSRRQRREVIASPVEYGPYLEYGTREQPARPHIVPAATTIARNVERLFDRLDRR